MALGDAKLNNVNAFMDDVVVLCDNLHDEAVHLQTVAWNAGRGPHTEHSKGATSFQQD